MLNERSWREKSTYSIFRLCKILENANESNMTESRSVMAWGWWAGGGDGQTVKLPAMRGMRSRNLTYSMVTILNAVLYTGRLLREKILNVITTHTRAHTRNSVRGWTC